MKARLLIDMDNAAFEEPAAELARILRELAEELEQNPGMVPGQGSARAGGAWTARDGNGNKVGYLSFYRD